MKKRIVMTLAYGACLLGILGAWAIMHTYLLSSVPRGLHLDEAGMAYDAFCIANWGVDRYLNPYPVYFYNYGGGMSAAYVYLCAFFIKLLGSSTAVYRLPGVLFSLITGVSIFFIVKRAFGKNWALLSAFLYTVIPYFTSQSRFGLDCNLMLGAVALALWIFLEALDRDKWYWYVLDGILWGLVLYTYIVSYMVLPIFLLIACVYLLAIKKINLKKLLYAAIPFIILALPLITMSVITFFQLDPIVTKYFSIPCINGQRMNEFSFNILGNLKNVFKTLLINDGINYNSLFGYYVFYNISIPFCIIGLLASIKEMIDSMRKRTSSVSLIICFYFFAQLIIASIKIDLNMNNMNGIYVTVLFFIVAGIKTVFSMLSWLAQYLTKRFAARPVKLCGLAKYLFLVIIIAVYVNCFNQFRGFYFKEYRYITSYLFSPQLYGVYEKFEDILEDRAVFMDTSYANLLLQKGLAPHDLGLSVGKEVQSYDNFTFRTIYTPFPDDLNRYDVYVIQEASYEDRKTLNASDFKMEQVYGYFVYYK